MYLINFYLFLILFFKLFLDREIIIQLISIQLFFINFIILIIDFFVADQKSLNKYCLNQFAFI